MGITSETESHFTCVENDDGLVKTLIIDGLPLTEDNLKYIFDITSLETLKLNDNQISSLPEDIDLFSLSSLKEIAITDNDLKEVPSGFENLKSVKKDLTLNCIPCSTINGQNGFVCKGDNSKEIKCLPKCGIIDGEIVKCSDNQCCSEEGYCGTGEEYCYSSNGCQPEYGVCRCSNNEKDICSNGYCCSAKGYCGDTNAFCSLEKGCQSEFGECTDSSVCPEVKSSLGITSDSEKNFKCGESEGSVKTLIINGLPLTNENLEYIFSIDSLVTLELNNNGITSLPESIDVSVLKSLQELSITDNELREVPSGLESLENVEKDLSLNCIPCDTINGQNGFICSDDNINDKKCLPRCGEEFGSCPNEDDCCSADGYCGTSKKYCYSSN